MNDIEWCKEYMRANIPHLVSTEERMRQAFKFIAEYQESVYQDCGQRPVLRMATAMFVYQTTIMGVANE